MRTRSGSQYSGDQLNIVLKKTKQSSKKATPKMTPAKKATPAKKTPIKMTPAKKTPIKKTPTKKTSPTKKTQKPSQIPVLIPAKRGRGKQPSSTAAATKRSKQNDGLTEKTAISVNNIGEEYQVKIRGDSNLSWPTYSPNRLVAVCNNSSFIYLGATYPGYRVRMQALMRTGHDRISIETADGKQLSIYFDIKKFFPMDD